MAVKKEESFQLDASDVLSSQLKDNKDKHLNFVKEHYYRVSTGSLKLDLDMGTLMPGVHRLVGIPESGKTSFSFEVAREFLKTANRRVLYVKAEGKLSREMMDRTGIPFVLDPSKWKDGTIFVLESNTYEFIVNTIRKLMRNNPKETEFLIIIDSTDGLITEADQKKEFGENRKVAGTPLLTKQFLQDTNLEICKYGHIVLLLSQHSSNIQIDPYAPDDGNKTVSGGGSGGWAALHFANFILEFKPRYQKDWILQNNSQKPDRQKNKIIGHKVKIAVKKSPNETTGLTFDYPVKYHVIGKSSVWKEKEIIDILIGWQTIKQRGAWFDLEPSIMQGLKDKGLPVKEKYHGEAEIFDWLTENPKVVKHFGEIIDGYRLAKDKKAVDEAAKAIAEANGGQDS